MGELLQLLRSNRNYRFTWAGQIVSEIGDNFNNIAVFALAMALTHSGMVVTGVLLARAIPAITMGPLAGVLLDRFDRKRIMIASDLIRALVALGFILAITSHRIWVLYAFSALLMAASPFFNEFAHADHPVDDAYRRHLSWRHRNRHRLQMGIRLQRVFIHLLGMVHLASASSRCSRVSRQAQDTGRG
jgi:MFS family permease